MVDVQRQVETQFTLIDRVTAPLRKVTAGAERMTSMFDKASATVAKFGGIAAAAAGGFAVGSSILGAQRYLQTVQEISDAFGFQAEQVDSVLEGMFMVNIQAQEGRGVIEQMSLAMARTKMEIQRAGIASSDAGRLITNLGINLEKGPVSAFVRMAELAQANKLSMAELNIAFQIPQQTASKLIILLKQGPGEVSKIMTELQKRGMAVNSQNIAAFKEYQAAQLRMKGAWDRIWIVVMTKVMPTITNLMDTIGDKFDGWSEKAGEWGEKVAKFLKQHLGTLLTIGKVMTANYAIQKLTGIGIGGAAMRAGRMIGRVARGPARVAAAVGPARVAVGLARAAPVIGPARAGPLARALMGLGKGNVVSALSSFSGAASRAFPTFARIVPGLLRFGAMALRLTLVGAAIGLVVGLVTTAVGMIRNNVHGIRDTILQFWQKWQARVMVMWDLIKPLVDALKGTFSKEGVIGKFFIMTVGTIITSIGSVVDGILLVIQTIIIAIKKLSEDWRRAISDPIGIFAEAMGEAQFLTIKRQREMVVKAAAAPEVAAAVTKAPGVRPPAPYNDFRGSKFDIKQMFAEGFDPDRIAVAFANDLAALGEKRVQSGLAPLFSVR